MCQIATGSFCVEILPRCSIATMFITEVALSYHSLTSYTINNTEDGASNLFVIVITQRIIGS